MADYISREAALEEIQEHFNQGGFAHYYDGKKLHDKIKAIPSADVEPVRHGRWIYDDDGCMICSECGNPAEVNCLDGSFLPSNYCNDCGARMDGK